MNAAELRAIVARSPQFGKHASGVESQASTSTPRRRWRVRDILYYASLGFCGLAVLGTVGLVLEGPEAREARWAEEARLQQVRAVENQKADIEAAKQAKEDAKMARLDACTKAELYAFAVSQDAVRAQLRAPSTATFPLSPILSQHVGNCQIKVLAYVDAQNGFGAMLRTNYMAMLSYEPDTERWQVKSIKMDE